MSNKPINNQFCSQSCSTKYNNARRARKAYYCKRCGSLLGYGYKKYSRTNYCSNCNSNTIDWGAITYGELKSKRKYQENSRIRTLARDKALSLGKLSRCSNCGYDKHVDTCHVKAIVDHSDDTLISEINSPENLIGLCKNCHWEFDNGLLPFNPLWV